MAFITIPTKNFNASLTATGNSSFGGQSVHFARFL